MFMSCKNCVLNALLFCGGILVACGLLELAVRKLPVDKSIISQLTANDLLAKAPPGGA